MWSRVSRYVFIVIVVTDALFFSAIAIADTRQAAARDQFDAGFAAWQAGKWEKAVSAL